MTDMSKPSWLLLLYSLPTKRNTERAAVWRRLKKMGAVQLTTATYLLPALPAQYEQFQWLAQQVRDHGNATLVRAQEIEGMPNEKLIALFNRARDEDYTKLKKGPRGLLPRRGRKKSDAETAATALARLVTQFREIREV